MKKTTYLVAITLVIAGLLTVVSASAMVQTSQKQEQKVRVILNYEPVIEGIDMAMAQSENFAYRPVPLSAVPVATGIHPAAASDAFGTVVAGFEAEDNVWFTTSIDSGASFNENAVGWTFTSPPSYPDADSCGDGRFIASVFPNYLDADGSQLHKFTTADPNNIPDGWTGVYWEWTTVGSGYYDFTKVAVGGYTEGTTNDTWSYGGHSMIGTYNHATPIVGTPFFSYQSNTGGSAWIYRLDTAKVGGTSTAMDIDQETNHGFALYNYNNAGNMDLYVYENNFGTWVPYSGSYMHPDVKEVNILSAGNDTDVDIAALNNNVIIVSQRDGAIVAYYSENALTTVNEVTIDTEGVNPRVAFSDEGRATCSYVKSGQVYVSLTEDGGATWDTPAAIDEPENVDVPSEFKASDTCGLGVVWQQLDGNVYFANVGSAPPVPPILDITGITGGTKVAATITNTGGSPATNVTWTMTITGGILGRINKTYTGNIATLAPAGSGAIQSTGIVLGLGKITITITATCDEGVTKTVSSAGKVLIIFIRI